MPKLILASASPRRLDLLSGLKLDFQVIASNVDESIHDGAHPRETVLELAERKARFVAENLDTASQDDSCVVLGADTIVVIDTEILGKPCDEDDAREMLAKLSGREHVVYTGVALVCLPSNKIFSDVVTSKVRFKILDKREIDALIASGETMDKAGAYALQGMAAAFVERIDGCVTNIIGLPLTTTTNLLRQAGIPVFDLT